MRDFKCIAVLYLCAALALSIIPESSAKLEGPHTTNWHVHVVNGLSGGKQLVVHCKSDIDDLGIHNLGPGGDFNWHFHVNLPQSTKFSCDWRSGNLHALTDVFWKESEHKWLRNKCDYTACFWTAKDDGIYLKDLKANLDERVHPWQ